VTPPAPPAPQEATIFSETVGRVLVQDGWRGLAAEGLQGVMGENWGESTQE